MDENTKDILQHVVDCFDQEREINGKLCLDSESLYKDIKYILKQRAIKECNEFLYKLVDDLKNERIHPIHLGKEFEEFLALLGIEWKRK